MTSMVAVCAILCRRVYSLLQSNIMPPSVSDSAPLASTVRCRTCEFSAVSISCGK